MSRGTEFISEGRRELKIGVEVLWGTPSTLEVSQVN